MNRTSRLKRRQKREAVEELGLGVNVSRTIATFDVTLISKDTGEHLKIAPFVVVRATPIGGEPKKEYAPDRKILFVRKDQCGVLSQNLEVPIEYEWMIPYFCVSREVIGEFFR